MKKIILSALMLMGVISVTKAGDWNIYDSKVPLDSIVMESGRTWSKMEVEYENGKISCLTYFYRASDAAWDISSRQLYTYDAQGREVEMLLQSFTDGAWRNSNKTVRTYDSPNAKEPSKTVTSYFHKGSQQWINQDKTEVTFNSDGLPTDYRIYTWLTDAWSAVQWGQVKYNEQNQRSEYILQTWIKSKEAWVNSMRYIYYYDDHGNTIKTTSDEWDQTVSPNDWTLVNTEETSYNDGKKPIVSISTREQKSVIISRYKYEFFYNSVGDTEKLVAWDWNISGESWVLNATDRFYYHDGQAIESVTGSPSSVTHKFMKDGQVYILRADKLYTLQGQEIK